VDNLVEKLWAELWITLRGVNLTPVITKRIKRKEILEKKRAWREIRHERKSVENFL
jgi:hypothetical protein